MTLTPTATQTSLDLAGTWTCRLDPDNVGELEQWFRTDLTDLQVELPGSLQHQGIGDPVSLDTPWTGGIVDRSFFDDDRYAPYRTGTDISVPFWLQPRVYYRGAAWYQRTIEIPAEWADRAIVLELERVHTESTIWVGEQRIGSQRSLSAPHRYTLGRLQPGQHRLTMRIDNRTVVDVGPNAHSVSDHTQGNWNGVIGALTLTPVPDITISRIRAVPDVARRAVTVRVDIAAPSAGVGSGTIQATARLRGSDIVVATATGEVGESGGPARDLSERGLSASGAHVDVELELGADAALWDEFSPALYDIEVQLHTERGGRSFDHTARTTVGLREVSTVGTQIAVNGRRTFLRGTLECCVFPLTGYPPTDLASWERIIDVCRQHGLNHIRFHSWCPPEAAFEAADAAGMYLQVEGPVWANQGAAVGEGRPVDDYLHAETQRILDTYGNHPSFIMMAHGNEPGGRDQEFLSSWVARWRSVDPRRLYTTGAGWPADPGNDYDNIPQPRAHRWGEGLGSRLNAQPPATTADYREWVTSRDRPIVSHEIGQWCAYPDFTEVERYTGLMQPKNFGIFADFLREAGMLDQAPDFLHASGRLQTLCYKEDIEAALRTDGFGGFHLLGLSDFPGQGTALVGVLNPFWESKGYVEASEFSRFCGPTVPLARLPRRIVGTDDEITFEVQVAHFGPEPLPGEVRWSLRDAAGAVSAEGTVTAAGPLEVGNDHHLGQVTVPPLGVTEPTQVTLVLEVTDAGGTVHANDWDLWVFPEGPEADPTDRVQVTSDLEAAVRAAEAGADVLLELDADAIGHDIEMGFTPVFWNTAWTRGQAPHTLGLLHDAEHPVFEGFPTQGSTDWQWWEPLHGARPMVLDQLPDGVRPLVQPIDTWFEARRLGALIEVRVGQGRMIVSSLNLSTGLAARALRRSVLAYMSSDRFAPEHEVTAAALRSLGGSR